MLLALIFSGRVREDTRQLLHPLTSVPHNHHHNTSQAVSLPTVSLSQPTHCRYTHQYIRTMSMLLSVIVMFGMFAQAKVGVDGEFDRVLEVEMYGSRPVDSLVVPSRQDYYKYEELSDGDNPSVTSVSPDSNHHHPGDFTKSGYNKKIGGGGRGGKGHHHHSDQRQAHTHHHHGPGSCYQCSSLTDKTGYCKVITIQITQLELLGNSYHKQIKSVQQLD